MSAIEDSCVSKDKIPCVVDIQTPFVSDMKAACKFIVRERTSTRDFLATSPPHRFYSLCLLLTKKKACLAFQQQLTETSLPYSVFTVKLGSFYSAGPLVVHRTLLEFSAVILLGDGRSSYVYRLFMQMLLAIMKKNVSKIIETALKINCI